MKKNRLVLFAALFSLVMSANTGMAQQLAPVFSAPVDTAFHSSRYVANIRVSKFNKIVGMQFSLSWDSTVLTFDSVGQFGLPLSVSNNFGLQSVSSGTLRFAWSDEGLKGTDMKDGATLFSVFFRPVGATNTTSPIRFSDVPTPIEVVDISFSAIKAEFRNGSVTIAPQVATSVQSSEPEWLDIRSAFPNPLHAQAALQVEFFSKSTQPVLVRLIDVQGKVVSEQEQEFATGLNRLEIPASSFPAPGIYLIRLVQGGRHSTQKILFR